MIASYYSVGISPLLCALAVLGLLAHAFWSDRNRSS